MKVPILFGGRIPTTHEKPWTTDQIRAWYAGLVKEQERRQRELIEQAREEGRKKGFRIGIQIGIEIAATQIDITQAVRRVLLRQIVRRFGQVPASVLDRIEAADQTALQRWIGGVLTAQSLSEVFDEPS